MTHEHPELEKTKLHAIDITLCDNYTISDSPGWVPFSPLSRVPTSLYVTHDTAFLSSVREPYQCLK